MGGREGESCMKRYYYYNNRVRYKRGNRQGCTGGGMGERKGGGKGMHGKVEERGRGGRDREGRVS